MIVKKKKHKGHEKSPWWEEPAQGLKEMGLKSIGKEGFVPSKKYSFSPGIPELIKLILALV